MFFTLLDDTISHGIIQLCWSSCLVNKLAHIKWIVYAHIPWLMAINIANNKKCNNTRTHLGASWRYADDAYFLEIHHNLGMRKISLALYYPRSNLMNSDSNLTNASRCAAGTSPAFVFRTGCFLLSLPFWLLRESSPESVSYENENLFMSRSESIFYWHSISSTGVVSKDILCMQQTTRVAGWQCRTERGCNWFAKFIWFGATAFWVCVYVLFACAKNIYSLTS